MEYRDLISSIRKIGERQKITGYGQEDRDIIAVAMDDSEDLRDQDAVVQVFFIRDGRLIGRDHFYLRVAKGDTKAQVLSSFLKQFYAGTPFIPSEIMLQSEIEDADIIEEWLSGRRKQKVCLLYTSVFFLADISLAGCLALLHMIVQTGPVLSGISRKTAVAGAYLIQLPHQFDHVLYCSAACIGTKISCLVLFHSPGKKHSRVWLMNCHLNKRIALVIFEHGIIFRTMFLDKITLQHKGFQLRIRNNVLKSGKMCIRDRDSTAYLLTSAM